MDDELLPAGKLPLPLLERLLRKYAWTDESVVVGPAVGEDAAVINADGKLLVLKSDPITFVADDIGSWSLVINANDIAVMGARPKWFLATVLLPEGRATGSMVEEIMSELGKRCREMNISLCGGHTEITGAVSRPVVCGHMVGEADTRGVIKSSGARPGNLLVLSKGIAIEGTAVLAREAGIRLAHLGDEFCRHAASFTRDPGISVVMEARVAASHRGVTAMHDPTEGGLSTALCELAEASGTGVELFLDKVHIYAETKRICGELGIDPMGLLASGALLIAVEEDGAGPLCESIAALGVDATVIGRFTDETGNLIVAEGKRKKPLKRFERDEVAKALSP